MNVRILCALAHLDPIDREVWIDHNLCGRGLLEIGASLGVTRQMVSLRKQRAERRLREILETPERAAA